MSKMIIEKTIEVKTLPEKIWRVFTDPVITRSMGGEYVTDWKQGSAIGWKAIDGHMYTRGTIVAIEPGVLFKHELFDLDNKELLLSTVTYTFKRNNDITNIYAKEELNYNLTADQLEEVSEGWDFGLKLIKEAAEKL